MPENALIIDTNLCTGCHSCAVACKQEHELEKDMWGIKVKEETGMLPNGESFVEYVPFITEVCNLCKHLTEKGKRPACVKACPCLAMSHGTIGEMVNYVKDHSGTILLTSKNEKR